MRWSVGRQINWRGAGLGNEVFPWAKAHLGAVVMGAKEVATAWRLNPYSFGKTLQGNYRDTLVHRATSHAMPYTDFDVVAYRATGEINYADAMRVALATGAISHRALVIRHTSAMAGGHLGIADARDYLRMRPLGDRDATAASEIVRRAASESITVGIHVQRGDFSGTGSSVVRDVFNQSMPLSWFTAACRDLAHRASRPLTVVVASNDPNLDLDVRQLDIKRPVLRPGTTAIGDLAALVACDVILPSVSSFSLLALFLRSSRYAWPREHLYAQDGWLSIWGGETRGWGQTITERNMGLRNNTDARPRGVPLGAGQPWPKEFIEDVAESVVTPSVRERDLIYYGAVVA